MSGETVGPLIGGLGLATFAGTVIAIRAGALDAVVAAATRGAGAAGGVVVLVAVAFVAMGGGRAGGSVGRSTGGRSVSVHAHAHGGGPGVRRRIARHEAGHAAAARALGGRVNSATVDADNRGGLVQATLPTQDSQAAITFWLAGQRALRSTEGAGADNGLIRRELRQVPHSDRGQVMRDARRHADQIVRQNAGRIRRDANRLDREGRL